MRQTTRAWRHRRKLLAAAVVFGFASSTAVAAPLEIKLDGSLTPTPAGTYVQDLYFNLNQIGPEAATLLKSLGFSSSTNNPLAANASLSPNGRLAHFTDQGIGVCGSYSVMSPVCFDPNPAINGGEALQFTLPTAPAGFRFYLVAAEFTGVDADDDLDLIFAAGLGTPEILGLNELNIRKAASLTARAYKGAGYEADGCEKDDTVCWIDFRDLRGNLNNLAEKSETGYLGGRFWFIGDGPRTTETSSDDFMLRTVVWELEALLVPEPGTLALFGLALAGLGVARRR